MALEFHCADVGVACSTVTTAQNKDELLAKVSDHASKAHGVDLNDTLISYALTQVRDTDAKPDTGGTRSTG